MDGDVRSTINWRSIIRTGLAYGVGLMAGNLVSQLLFSLLNPEFDSLFSDGTQLAIGIVLIVLVSGLGGAIGGFLGGWTLPVVGEKKGKYGFAWRSAFSVGIVNGIFLLLVAIGLAILAMRAAAYIPVSLFMQVYLIVGMIMGALIGLLLGLTTMGWRRTGSVLVAGIVGFGLGGAALGAGIWTYLGSTDPGRIYGGDHILLLIGLFAYGFLGGSAFGFAYDRLNRRNAGLNGAPVRPWIRYALYGLLGFFVLLLLIQVQPQIAILLDLLTPRAALQTETIAADTVGVHWQEVLPLTTVENKAATLDLSTGKPDSMALIWAGGENSAEDIHLRIGQRATNGEIIWGTGTNVSNSKFDSHIPSMAMDSTGAVHVAWLEGSQGAAYYNRCSNGECADPLPMKDATNRCPSGNVDPDILSVDVAANPHGKVMTVWSDLEGGLQYRVLPDGSQGCVPLPEGAVVGSFSLSNVRSDGFSLVFEDMEDRIWITRYSGANWTPEAEELGSGMRPDVLVAGEESERVAWCAKGSGVQFWHKGQTEKISQLSCHGRPSVAIDGTGRTHVVWHSDEIVDWLGAARQEDVLYEAIGDGELWSAPAIVARLEAASDYDIESYDFENYDFVSYDLVNDGAGNLQLAWIGNDSVVHYARQQLYECDPRVLSGVEAELYKVARLGGYRPEDDVIPFCQNRYEKMVFTPVVDPAFSDAEPTLNGAYDDYVQLLETADYEALFTTMVYEKAANEDSPGAVLARGIVDLYEKVKANPQMYPRGMLVRILLGNSPASNFEQLELDGGLWYVLEDLKEAGLKKMVDSELGWRVEIGNYAGRWPHSHVKAMIIDGETVIVSGFNHEYKPLPDNHPSNKGFGDTDTGLVVSGPVAQQSRRIFDQLWTGAIQRHCPDLDVSETELRLTCTDSPGVPDHVPEVMRYSLSEDEAVAFSMYRNQAYDEADKQLIAAFHSADESIDLAQAMFSMDWICNLNHFFGVCDFGQAPPYMEALMDASENGAKLRIILAPYPTQHIENVIAMRIFNEEADDRGLADRIEIRMFDDLLHTKSAMIDDKFVIVGSQNLHWSAFGDGNGLSELNLGVGDPGATEQYKNFFDYLWKRSPSLGESSD